jgi:hypothetical protein
MQFRGYCCFDEHSLRSLCLEIRKSFTVLWTLAGAF